MVCQPPLLKRAVRSVIRTLEAQQLFREENKLNEVYRGSNNLCVEDSLAFEG